MGIPRLTSDLARHGEPVRLGQSTTRSDIPTVRYVVIDGPSLVYHVYYRLFSLTSSKSNPLQAQPSSLEVQHGVRTLLTKLQDHGVEIKCIYFDGALPTSKRATRRQRLERESQKLHAFHKEYSKPSRASPQLHDRRQRAAAGLLDTSQPLPVSFSNLPAPPFMVPAVIEDLHSQDIDQYIRLDEGTKTSGQASKCQSERSRRPLQSPIKVVAAEADEACAAYSMQTGATILTDDSDLLIYDLGEKGSVIKLGTLELDCRPEHEAGEESIKALQWRPRAIAQKLQISGLNRLAFERSKEQYSSYANILRCARQSQSATEKDGFMRFSREYSSSLSDSSSLPELIKLDPRTSELFLQIKHPTHNTTCSDVPHIYLPVLLENPTRTCSWAYGARFRRLAYSLLTLSVPTSYRPREILEHQRRGTQITAVGSISLSLEEIESELRLLKNLFSSSCGSSGAQCGSLAFWIVFGFLEVSRSLMAEGKLPISQEWIVQFLDPGRLDLPFTWDDLHAYANAQVVLYSLRILKQIFSVVRDSLPAKLSLSAAYSCGFLDDLPDLCSLSCSSWEIPRGSQLDEYTAAMISDAYTFVKDVYQ